MSTDVSLVNATIVLVDYCNVPERQCLPDSEHVFPIGACVNLFLCLLIVRSKGDITFRGTFFFSVAMMMNMTLQAMYTEYKPLVWWQQLLLCVGIAAVLGFLEGYFSGIIGAVVICTSLIGMWLMGGTLLQLLQHGVHEGIVKLTGQDLPPQYVAVVLIVLVLICTLLVFLMIKHKVIHFVMEVLLCPTWVTIQVRIIRLSWVEKHRLCCDLDVMGKDLAHPNNVCCPLYWDDWFWIGDAVLTVGLAVYLYMQKDEQTPQNKSSPTFCQRLLCNWGYTEVAQAEAEETSTEEVVCETERKEGEEVTQQDSNSSQ